MIASRNASSTRRAAASRRRQTDDPPELLASGGTEARYATVALHAGAGVYMRVYMCGAAYVKRAWLFFQKLCQLMFRHPVFSQWSQERQVARPTRRSRPHEKLALRGNPPSTDDHRDRVGPSARSERQRYRVQVGPTPRKAATLLDLPNPGVTRRPRSYTYSTYSPPFAAHIALALLNTASRVVHRLPHSEAFREINASKSSHIVTSNVSLSLT